ncbi:hypothetical protein BDN70DRAFT_978364 [Pholiota conissans]|uniref:Uncharacterized protein n=1 Tax=Pholiota conissans TaxID=109636 RepID=A0A9P6CLI5_9AGAR|nr:hypothetical protein BDN70DRAFT_978364 [Pholiota conissans]
MCSMFSPLKDVVYCSLRSCQGHRPILSLRAKSQPMPTVCLRNRSGLKQSPHVLSWLSWAENIPVGAEYIIMDVAVGAELHLAWHTLTMKQKLQLVYQWIKIESAVIGLPSKGCACLRGWPNRRKICPRTQHNTHRLLRRLLWLSERHKA